MIGLKKENRVNKKKLKNDSKNKFPFFNIISTLNNVLLFFIQTLVSLSQLKIL